MAAEERTEARARVLNARCMIVELGGGIWGELQEKEKRETLVRNSTWGCRTDESESEEERVRVRETKGSYDGD